MDRRVKAAIQFIQAEPHQNPSIRELARRVNLSPWHFTRLFKGETAVTPKQYIREFKMRLAKQLLSESFLSIKEIAASVGAGDRSHFSRDFKRLHGSAPSIARANH